MLLLGLLCLLVLLLVLICLLVQLLVLLCLLVLLLLLCLLVVVLVLLSLVLAAFLDEAVALLLLLFGQHKLCFRKISERFETSNILIL